MHSVQNLGSHKLVITEGHDHKKSCANKNLFKHKKFKIPRKKYQILSMGLDIWSNEPYQRSLMGMEVSV